MTRILLAASAVLLIAGAADAKPRKTETFVTAPVRLPQSQIEPIRPSWAPPGSCFTDEGYGRFTPCGAGGRG